MSTIEPTIESKTAEAGNQIQSSVNAYIDRLVQGHARFAKAIGTARTRNARVADKFIETMITGQREALELSKAIAAEPTAYGKNIEAIMQSMTHAQERSLDLAKTFYREQSEATDDVRVMVEPLIEASKNFGKPFEKMAEMWTPANK